MLVLTRKKGESLLVGDDIEVIVLGSEGDTVKLGIRAPKQVSIFRKEVYLAIQESNREASSGMSVSPAQLHRLFQRNKEQ